MTQHYKDLIVWRKAMDLVNLIYEATELFPKRETYSLRIKFVEPRSPFPAISPRARRITANASFDIFFDTHEDRGQNSKLKSSSHNAGIIYPTRKGRKFSGVPTK